MKQLPFPLLIIFLLILTSCKKTPVTPQKDIVYKTDGRSVRLSDIDPLTLDIDGNDTLNFSFFFSSQQMVQEIICTLR